MGSTPVAALIISGKSALRDGLTALLDSLPQLSTVHTVGTLGEALGESGSEWCPSLVVLDIRASTDDAWLAVQRVRSKWQTSRCVVLTENVAQQAEAEAAGADAVIVNGIRAARLVAAIMRVLAPV